jgi:hypothetical protein
MEAVWKKEFALSEMTKASEFKTYEVLKQRLDKVLGLNGEVVKPKTTVEQLKEAPKKAPALAEVDDDDISYFSKLAEEN